MPSFCCSRCGVLKEMSFWINSLKCSLSSRWVKHTQFTPLLACSLQFSPFSSTCFRLEWLWVFAHALSKRSTTWHPTRGLILRYLPHRHRVAANALLWACGVIQLSLMHDNVCVFGSQCVGDWCWDARSSTLAPTLSGSCTHTCAYTQSGRKHYFEDTFYIITVSCGSYSMRGWEWKW